MTEARVGLVGTIVDTEDHYGTCAVRIDYPDDRDHSVGVGLIWLPIPERVDDPGKIAGYRGRRVVVTVEMMDAGMSGAGGGSAIRDERDVVVSDE